MCWGCGNPEDGWFLNLESHGLLHRAVALGRGLEDSSLPESGSEEEEEG